MARREKCSLCGKELEFRYSLQKPSIAGYVCGSCYDKKLKEIYNIKC